jgi:hypothetical protein
VKTRVAWVLTLASVALSLMNYLVMYKPGVPPDTFLLIPISGFLLFCVSLISFTVCLIKPTQRAACVLSFLAFMSYLALWWPIIRMFSAVFREPR